MKERGEANAFHLPSEIDELLDDLLGQWKEQVALTPAEVSDLREEILGSTGTLSQQWWKNFQLSMSTPALTLP